jgi:SIR2-like protein
MSLLEETIEEHYEYVAEALCYGSVVTLLGAGVNLCEPDRRGWERGRNLPNGRELSEHIADKYGYKGEDREDLLRMSQYAQDKRGDGTLRDHLHRVFAAEYKPTVVHEFLATLPAQLKRAGGARHHQLIVTTNYDDALEKALTAAEEPFDLVWYSTAGCRPGTPGRFLHKPPDGPAREIKRPNESLLSVEDRTVVLKIHGAVSRTDKEDDSYVISEDHYIAFLTNTSLQRLIPKALVTMLLESHFLFLGYSLGDWNLRVILHQVFAEREHDRDSWAILKDVHEIDRVLWRSRDVYLHEVPLELYVEELSERVAALNSGQPIS